MAHVYIEGELHNSFIKEFMAQPVSVSEIEGVMPDEYS
jgi:hypothetical protein